MPGAHDFYRVGDIPSVKRRRSSCFKPVDFMKESADPVVLTFLNDLSEFFEPYQVNQDFSLAKNDGGKNALRSLELPGDQETSTSKSRDARKKLKKLPNTISLIEKQFEDVLKQKMKLDEGTTFPVDYKSQVADLAQTCLRLPKKTKIPKKLKVYPEAPITVRLGWFMEKQLENTSLVNPPYSWETSDVVDWICDTLRLPQYKEMFEINQIKGRHLPLIDAEKLEKMGMIDFHHIITVSQEIRKLLKIGKEIYVWNKVTEARYDPQTLHNMYNYRFGKDKWPVSAFYKEHKVVHKREPNCSLFDIFPTTWDIFPRNVHRINRKTYFLNKFDSYPKDRKKYEIEKFW